MTKATKPVVEERQRAAFESQSDYASRLLFKRGGSIFAENIDAEEYVDSGVQAAWEQWQRAWSAALSVPKPIPDLDGGSNFMVGLDSMLRQAETFDEGKISTTAVRSFVMSFQNKCEYPD